MYIVYMCIYTLLHDLSNWLNGLYKWLVWYHYITCVPPLRRRPYRVCWCPLERMFMINWRVCVLLMIQGNPEYTCTLTVQYLLYVYLHVCIKYTCMCICDLPVYIGDLMCMYSIYATSYTVLCIITICTNILFLYLMK